MLTGQPFVARALVFACTWVALVNTLSGSPPCEADSTPLKDRHGFDPKTPLASRVTNTPASVLAKFRDIGPTAPSIHSLTAAERSQIDAVIRSLPPLHRHVLGARLRALSFLDGMPNTALTSTVNPNEAFRLFDITVNAGILHENVSQWLTRKEQRCFDIKGSPLRVSVEAGTKVDALLYVLLHEATHIVDLAEQITPGFAPDGLSKAPNGPARPFTQGVWIDLALPVAAYRDPVRGSLLYYGASRPIPIDRAPEVYAYLRRTPFASLYGGRNWLDDLAEFVSVYHLTEVLKQPYRIVVRRDNDEVFTYEPMKSALVRSRIAVVKQFYAGS
jgi:hypothetical protein